MKLLKKFLCGVLSAAILLMPTSLSAMARDNIKVMLDGRTIKFDVQPQIINDRTMVPLRAIFEALGASVDWNSKTKTVTSQKGSTKIELTINSNIMYVNNSKVTIDAPACIIDDRTLVPLRAISEAYSTEVNWDEINKTVKMYSADSSKQSTASKATPKPTATPQTKSTVSMGDLDNIGDSFNTVPANNLIDNYGNTYSYAYCIPYTTSLHYTRTFETLLNKQYKRFTATIYVEKGCTKEATAQVKIKKDGQTIYTSPNITKTSYPIDIDVDITGCNDFQIEIEDGLICNIAEGKFYKNSSSSSNSTGNTERRSGPHCPNCGSTSFVQLNGGSFLCSECGTKY